MHILQEDAQLRVLWEVFVIEMIADILVLLSIPVIDTLKTDNRTDTFIVNSVKGNWDMLAIGLIAENDSIRNYTKGFNALYKKSVKFHHNNIFVSSGTSIFGTFYYTYDAIIQ